MSFTPTDNPPHGAPLTGLRGGFWQRFVADAIDAVIVAIAYLILATLLHTAGRLLLLVIGIGYFTLLEGGPSGQTLGKKAMNIRVGSIDDNGPIGYQRALARDLGRILSTIPLYLGYLWMLWDPQKQTWHDKLAHAVVVPTSSYVTAFR